MIGTKTYKNDINYDDFNELIKWAEQHDAVVIDTGDCYECIEIPVTQYEPTKAEKINAIKAEYEPRFKTLEEAQRRLLLMGKPTNAISTQYIKLNSEMVARIKEVQ